MSSTNKTTNYNLSQYIGSDKPTYLTDYNGDMFKIDAQMKLNADNVATAIQGATDASTLASTANSTATTANTNANTAIANNATTDAKLNTFMQAFNLSVLKNYNNNNATISGAGFTSIDQFTLTIATNSDGSLFKLYGLMAGWSSQSGIINVVLNNTGILVDSPYTINPAGQVSFSSTSNSTPVSIYVENNKMTLTWYNENAYVRALMFPCLYFNANFGDQPTPTPNN